MPESTDGDDQDRLGAGRPALEAARRTHHAAAEIDLRAAVRCVAVDERKLGSDSLLASLSPGAGEFRRLVAEAISSSAIPQRRIVARAAPRPRLDGIGGIAARGPAGSTPSRRR